MRTHTISFQRFHPTAHTVPTRRSKTPILLPKPTGGIHVPERYAPTYKLDPYSPEILSEEPHTNDHSNVASATFPKGCDRNDVAVLDVDGVLTDGPSGKAFHLWNLDTGFYRMFHQPVLEVARGYVQTKFSRDFLVVNELAARVLAGNHLAKIQKSAHDCFDWVFMGRNFNSESHSKGEKIQHRGFIRREIVENMLARSLRGGVNLLVSESSTFIVQAIVGGIRDYARKFWDDDMDIPKKTKLAHFVIGSAPRLDAKGIALPEIQQPSPIGIGKLELVRRVLDAWKVDPATVELYLDTLLEDHPLATGIGKKGGKFLVCPPIDQRDLATELGFEVIAIDKKYIDNRSPEEVEALENWRRKRIAKYAREYSV